MRRATVSYGYLTTSRLSDVRTSSILDYMRHKLSFAAEIRFLRRFSLAVTGTLFDRYGFYNRYLRDADGKLLTDDKGRMQTEEVDFSPYFLLDGHLRWEKGIVALHVDLANITDTDYCDFADRRLKQDRRLPRKAASVFLHDCQIPAIFLISFSLLSASSGVRESMSSPLI